MSTNETFLAVFLGSKTSAKMAAWNALPEADRNSRAQQGIADWHAWVDRHQEAIVAMGGPLGTTKKVDSSGIAEVSNQMGAFTVVRAPSHEAAAKMFENHPHFAIFSGRIRGDHADLANPGPGIAVRSRRAGSDFRHQLM